MNRIHTYSSALVIALALGSSPALADIDSAVSGTADVGVGGSLTGNQNGTLLNGGVNGEVTGNSTLSTPDTDDEMEDPMAPEGDSPLDNNAPDMSPDADQPEVIDTDSASNDSRPADDRSEVEADVGVDLDINSSINSGSDSTNDADTMDETGSDDVIDSEPVTDENSDGTSSSTSGNLSTRIEIEAGTSTSGNR